jgi:hypothetical protein
LSASEGNQKLQDELADLFDRQMSMTQFHSTPTQGSTGSSKAPNSSYGIPQPSPSPAHSVSPEQLSSIDVLRYHGLDPNTLTPNQLGLFENADSEQKERLIQTWQLYSRIGCENNAPVQDFGMADSAMDDSDGNTYAEPYMVSGYENNTNQVSLPKEPTTGEPYAGSKDPVYQSQEWWELTKSGPMESSYGAFEEMRRYYPSCGVYRC